MRELLDISIYRINICVSNIYSSIFPLLCFESEGRVLFLCEKIAKKNPTEVESFFALRNKS